VLVEVVAEAGDNSMASLSPFVFFFFDDFNCIGRDFGATVGCSEVSMTAGLALTLPGPAERERV
jgi:hypothetical protein